MSRRKGSGILMSQLCIKEWKLIASKDKVIKIINKFKSSILNIYIVKYI